MYVALSLILVCAYIVRRWIASRYLPRGPPSIPIFGSLPFLNGKGVRGITDPSLARYGKVAKIDVGPFMTFYVINDFQLAKELFAKDITANRNPSYYHKYVRGDNGQELGIINTSGRRWTEQRRFALKSLKDFGFGKRNLDCVIQGEADELIQTFIDESSSKGEVKIHTIFSAPVINVLWQIVGSKRFDHKADSTKEMMDLVNDRFKANNATRFFPFLRPYLPLTKGDHQILLFKKMIRDLILDHEEDHDSDSQPRDFIDVYLNEIEAEPRNGEFYREQLVNVCLDFFLAGAETTSTTLMWCVMYMSLFPEVQAKCQAEIDSRLGSRLPTSEDIQSLPYTQATIMEVQRISFVAPASLPHKTSEAIKVHDTDQGRTYTIPKGAVLFSNLRQILSDCNIFHNPSSFLPERFLTKKEEVKRPAEFVPFGVGKRICMGDALARNELFIFFASILQRTAIEWVESRGQPEPSQYTMGITSIPDPFYLSFKSRI